MLTLFSFFFSGSVSGLDISPDGSVVVGCSGNVVIAHNKVGCSGNVVIAHNTTTGAVLWQRKMPDNTYTLRIHGGVVVVPVDDSNTVVLDVITGHQLHTLPSAGLDVRGICVFDGSTFACFALLIVSHRVFILAPLTKVALKVDETIADSGFAKAHRLCLSLSVFVSPS